MSVLAQLALVTSAAPRPVPSAAGAASHGEAAPQKPGSKPRHIVSQQAAPVAASVSGPAVTSTPPVAPAGQIAAAAATGAENDGDAAADDTIAAPDATSRAGPSAGANRHQMAAAEAAGPDAASPAPSSAQGAGADANIAAPAPQAATHAAPVSTGAAALAVASVAGPAATTAAHAASAAAPPASATAPPTAVTQLAHATEIHFASGAPGQITIHLQPAELGAVQVRIERGHDGSATITVQVERADTLHALQADLPHLHQALDRAGVPAEARQVHMELAQAPPPGNAASAGGGDGQRQGQAQRGKAQSAAQGDPDETTEPMPRWRPAGINITA